MILFFSLSLIINHSRQIQFWLGVRSWSPPCAPARMENAEFTVAITGWTILKNSSALPDLVCQSTPSEDDAMTAGSLSQTLYHLVTVKQEGVARLESSSLHLRGVGLIHCHLKISRPCWTRLTTPVMNLLCLLVTLLLRSTFTVTPTSPFWRPTTDRSKAIIYLYLIHHFFFPVNSSSACLSSNNFSTYGTTTSSNLNALFLFSSRYAGSL